MFSETDAVTLADLRRRMANVVRISTVAEVDSGRALARVAIGDLETDWLPWMLRAGDDWIWHGVDAGEQVVVLAPCGDLGQAVILPSLHKETPVRDGDRLVMAFKDGSRIEFNRAGGRFNGGHQPAA